MSQPFGRRVPPPAPAWGTSIPLDPGPELPKPPPAGLDWRQAPDPEFEAWQAARAASRWRTWGMAGLIVLGGPMGFLMPDGIGQWAGFALMGVGAVGVLARLRKADPVTPEPAASEGL